MKCFEIFESMFLLTFFCTIVAAQNPLESIEGLAYEAIKAIVGGASGSTGHPVNRSDVTFYLYTSKDVNSTNHLLDSQHPTHIAVAKRKIYFFIHGWRESRESSPWYTPLTKMLLRKHCEDVILQVDWSRPAKQNYTLAAFATEKIGMIIGDFIFKIVNEYRLPNKNMVVIGHSLGAHVSSFTCKRFHELSGVKLPRLIGLDPAGPLFVTRPKDKKLNPNDAKHVMVVHTDTKFLGYPTDIGSADFYPNGGMDQPGCKLNSNLTTSREDQYCSHNRGYEYFVYAVLYPLFFIAKKCPSYQDFKNNKCDNINVSLGDLEATQKGRFFLDTDAEPPYFHTTEQKATKTNSRKRKLYQLQNWHEK